MEVALIRWPTDQALRTELAELQQPRLLLVEPDAEPPEVSDVLEDWVRLPVTRADRYARVRTLEERSNGEGHSAPSLDSNGTLFHHGETAQLSGIQATLMAALIDRFGAVVSRQALIQAAWPGGEATANNLDVSVARLRRQVLPLGLEVRTVRSRGYLLADIDGPR
jgi:two-component system OmpR family response regulator